jgi:hypothetical protein
MSLQALEALRNDKDAVRAVVAEHFMFTRLELQEMSITYKAGHRCPNMIEHGLWRFCFHPDEETVYLWE